MKIFSRPAESNPDWYDPNLFLYLLITRGLRRQNPEEIFGRWNSLRAFYGEGQRVRRCMTVRKPPRELLIDSSAVDASSIGGAAIDGRNPHVPPWGTNLPG
jgi:hypothetical protein